MIPLLHNLKTTWIDEEDNSILYKPLNNTPLIQKDFRTFECCCIPQIESTEVKVHWQLLARDFNRDGDFTFKVIPEYVVTRNIEYSCKKEDVTENISEYITGKI